jgi:signal transduction histidine kinase
MIKVEFHQFFALFSEKRREALLADTEHRLYESGTRIFDEGDVSDALYLVLDGEVELRKRTDAGKVEILARVRGDECFGEMGVLDGCGRSAAAYTVTDTRLARIPGEVVLAALADEPSSTVIRMFRSISDRLRRTDTDYVAETYRAGRFQQVHELSASLLRFLENPITALHALSDGDLSGISPREVGALSVMQFERVRQTIASLSQFADGRRSVTRSCTTAEDILARFTRRNVPFLEAKCVELVATGGHESVALDDDGILEVLQVLLNNAVEAGASRIAVRTYWQPSTLELSFSDDGQGVPERIRDTLFAPFVTEGKVAIGLGLAVAKGIIEGHGGHITYQPGDKQGSTFVVSLPIEETESLLGA